MDMVRKDGKIKRIGIIHGTWQCVGRQEAKSLRGTVGPRSFLERQWDCWEFIILSDQKCVLAQFLLT